MMLEEPIRDRRAERRETTRSEILDAAWAVAREHGLGSLSLKDVASRIGMRPPSLYWYFDSKHAIYDAMFAEGNRALLERMAGEEWPADARALLPQMARAFIGFCVEDPVRAQLLFQRPIPGFEPSAQSYAIAVAALDRARELLRAAGVTDPRHHDLWTALLAGLASQQLANDPAGDRWLALIDEAVTMYADHVLPTRRTRRTR